MRDFTSTGKQINSRMGKAISEYNMIEEGDSILVAVSGGKDSMTLLSMLKKIQSWAPVKFKLFAGHIITDFNGSGSMPEQEMTDFFESMDIPYRFANVNVLDKKGNTTCFWCSWNKRKALFELADDMGCNKVAFGHHKDDIVETVLMNLLYNGEISGMNPFQEMFKGKITIIRPLCYVEEKMLQKFAKENSFESRVCNCSFGDSSRRKYIKDFIGQTEKSTPNVNIKTNIFNSLSRIKNEYIDLREEGNRK